VGTTSVRVVFAYDPEVLPSAMDVEQAIAAASPDNSTDAVEVDPDGGASVLFSTDGWTGSTGDIGGTSISTSGVDDSSASSSSSSAMTAVHDLSASTSTHSLLFVTSVVTSTLAIWLSGVLQ